MGKITLKIGEIKRRTKKIGAFPSDDSAMRLAGSIIMDINEEYVTGRKYINREKSAKSKVIYNLQKIMYIIKKLCLMF